MRRINWKKPAAVAAALALSTALLAGCGSTAASSDSVAESTTVSESESTAEEAEEGDADEVAAKNCADLIDAIYVQERTDDTDAQCEAAKAAWDALTDTQKEMVEGENADPEYFGRDTGDASKDAPRNEDEIGENELLVVSFGTSFNGSRAAAVERGAKADDQQLVLADFIFVAGGVLAGVAGVAAEVLGVSVLTLDHFLLGVGQGIPGSLGGFALGVGVIGALLHVDGVDQVCAVLCGHLVSISFFGFLCGALALADGGAFGHAVRRSGGAATASQQCGGQGQGGCHSGGLFPVDSSHVFCFLSYITDGRYRAGRPQTQKGVHQNRPTKKRGLLHAEWQHKRPRAFNRFFTVQPIPRDLGRLPPYPAAGRFPG